MDGRDEAVRAEGPACAREPRRTMPPPREQGGAAVGADEGVVFIRLERDELEPMGSGQRRRMFITGEGDPVARCRQPAAQLDRRVNQAGQSSRDDEQVRVYVTSICRYRCFASRGKVTVKVAPWFVPRLLAVISPLIRSTRCLAIAVWRRR